MIYCKSIQTSLAKHIIEIWLDDLQIIQCANICSTYKRKEEMEGRPLSKNQETCLLQIKGVRKSFGMNAVLKGINLTLDRGEVLALIGGNGAGKSTLMKIIMGLYTEDEGDIFIDGKKVVLNKPAAALEAGIYMVPQEPLIFPNMTVEENILIGFKENQSVLHEALLKRIEETGFKLDLTRKASTLSIAEQELVEILRGLMREAQILILDEPTSALTFDEVESLFNCVRRLQEKGIGMVYITHRLNEVFELATTVAIMRDGMIKLSGRVEEFTREMLVKGLLPPNMDDSEAAEASRQVVDIDYENTKPLLRLENFTGYGFKDLNLEVYPGEILGVAGVVGAGRTEFATTIFGMDKVLGGKVYLEDNDITGLSTAKVLEAGVNYVPEDRHVNGLFKMRDVGANTTASILSRKKMGGFFLNVKEELQTALKYAKHFRTKITGLDQELGSLSGGNQQKVILARALAPDPKIIILDEPTRGIDAAARGDVYNIIQQLKKEGVGIMLISSDMEEIIELADRAVSVHQGRINAEFSREEINQDNLMAAAFGVVKEEKVG